MCVFITLASLSHGLFSVFSCALSLVSFEFDDRHQCSQLKTRP